MAHPGCPALENKRHPAEMKMRAIPMVKKRYVVIRPIQKADRKGKSVMVKGFHVCNIDDEDTPNA